MRTTTTRHSALCAAVRLLLTSWGCVAFPVKQMGTPVKGKPGVYRRGALMPGVADVIACGPRGRFVAVEVKVGRDVLSVEQGVFLIGVSNRGGIAIECRDTVDELLEREAAVCSVPSKGG